MGGPEKVWVPSPSGELCRGTYSRTPLTSSASLSVLALTRPSGSFPQSESRSLRSGLRSGRLTSLSPQLRSCQCWVTLGEVLALSGTVYLCLCPREKEAPSSLSRSGGRILAGDRIWSGCLTQGWDDLWNLWFPRVRQGVSTPTFFSPPPPAWEKGSLSGSGMGDYPGNWHGSRIWIFNLYESLREGSDQFPHNIH